MLATVRSRNLAVRILGEVRVRFGFLLVGYVIMPEHLHLLISESGSVSPAKVVQVFKQRVSRRMRGKKCSVGKQLSLRFPEDDTELRRFWQRRYHDFNVYSRAKLQEKFITCMQIQCARNWCSSRETGRGAVGATTIVVRDAADGCVDIMAGTKTGRSRTARSKSGPTFANPAKGRPPMKFLAF
jgi:REP element-mobilizing transposase RayT